MAKPDDLELKKAFAEQKIKTLDTARKLELADMEIDMLKRVMQHAQLTAKEIATYPSKTKTFESVGRMFLLTDIYQMCADLQKKSDNCALKIQNLEDNKVRLQKNLKESENNLREMVNQGRATTK